MKITWIGQAGLLMQTEEKTILIDPYLSDSVGKVQPQNYRRVPVDKSFLSVRPNVIVITHKHLDHLDKETLVNYLTNDSGVTVLAPNGSYQELREMGGNNNYVLFNNGTTWTEGNVVFRAVKAEHSDDDAIGVIVSEKGKNYYAVGDTLYSERVFESLPNMSFDVVFVPINGIGNNMNFNDAKNFACRLKAKKVVPIHFGMFDNINADDFECENKVVPCIYKEIPLF